jgi:hypothetical protein
MGNLRYCLDAATARRVSVFGRHFDEGDCKHLVTRDAPGLYRFSATCNLENGGELKTMGTAQGDFASSYTVHSEVNLSGAPIESLNGMHEIKILARYKGPCPAGMRPGDVSLGSGLKANLDRLPHFATALNGG